MRDVMGALKQLVLADDGVMGTLAESDGPGVPPAAERVFVNRVPRGFIESVDTHHPPKTVVLRMAGGVGKADLTALDSPTVTTLCYGESDLEADRVRRALWTLLVRAQRECVGDVLIHDAQTTGGPIPLVDPEIVWPAVAQSYTLTADVLDAA